MIARVLSTSTPCRYVEHVNQIRQVLASLHLAELQPDAIIVERPELLRISASDASSPLGPPASTRESPQQSGQRSSRPAHQHELMQVAAVLAVAAQTADALPRLRALAAQKRPAEATMEPNEAHPLPPCVLCIGFTERFLEPEVVGRWISYEVTVKRPIGAEKNEYRIACRNVRSATDFPSLSMVVEPPLAFNEQSAFHRDSQLSQTPSNGKFSWAPYSEYQLDGLT